MKIVHIITTICRGGAETQLLTLVRKQIELGYEVSIYYLKDDPELEPDFASAGANVNGILVGKNFLQQVLLFRQSLQELNSIIHAHLPKSELIASLAKSNNQFLISRHNSEPFYPGAPKFVSRLLSNWVSFRSFGCISISNTVKNYLTENRELLDSRNHWVVEYGFNSNFYKLKYKPKVSSDSEFTIGTVARLVPQKDLPTLIKGFAVYLANNDAARLLIVGLGSEEAKLKKLAEVLEISEKVNWVDRTSNVYDVMSTLDIFCLTSKYEGFGLVLLEAMQAEIPIVAANNSAIVEVLGEKYPFLFRTSDQSDLVEKLEQLSNPQHRDEAIKYLKIRLTLFSPEIMANKIDAIYVESLSRANLGK
jgi:glycosyltransferase involved in cell wall biosynthesis